MVLYNGPPANGDAIFSTNTQGFASPCQVVVSGALNGSWAVLDATNSVIYQQPPIPGTLAAGQFLAQVCSAHSECSMSREVLLHVMCEIVQPASLSIDTIRDVCHQETKLYSPDGGAFLIVQSDGNLVLYNVARLNQVGADNAGGEFPETVTWQYWVQHPGSLKVLCPAAGPAAVWYSGTYSATGAPFTLVMQNVRMHTPSRRFATLQSWPCLATRSLSLD